MNIISTSLNKKGIKKCIKFLCAAILLTGGIQAGAQVTVTQNQTATALAQKLVGTGVTILNPTLSCPIVANGIFTVTSSNLGIDSGIVLTSGRAKTVGLNYGVNGPASDFASNSNNAAGDPDLTTLAGQPTNDACILQFDFRPTGDTIKFDYVFGSEEYTGYTCSSFNDVFGFFISGPGYTGLTNIALVPGTTIPISINSVNGATASNNFSYSICTAIGPGSPFNAYYVDNVGSGGTSITYDGFTTVLQAIAAVTPCDTYHLKLGVADASDYILDSGVFIKAGSLSSNTVNVSPVGLGGNATTVPYCVRGCIPGKFIFSASAPAVDSQVFHYEIEGTAVNGYDYATIPDSVVIPANSTTDTLYINTLTVPPAGPQTIKLLILAAVGCNGQNTVVDSAEMIIYDSFNVHIVTPDDSICVGQSVQIEATSDSLLTYSWTPANTVSNDTTLDPILTPTNTTTYQLYANFPGAGCAPSHDDITVTVYQPPVVTATHDDTICVGSPIQFSATASPSYQPYTYSWSPNVGMDNPSELDPTVTPTSQTNITYTLMVNTPVPNCFGYDTVHLHVLPNDFNLLSPNDTVCLGGSDTIQANGSPSFAYSWSPVRGIPDPSIIAPIITPTDSPAVVFLDSTLYTVTASFPGCPDMPHQVMLYTQQVKAHIITPDTGFCIYQPVQIHASSNGVANGLWSPATNLDDPTSFDPAFLVDEPGTYMYVFTITTNAGCIGKDTINITTYPIVKITTDPSDTTINYGNSIPLNVNIVSGDPVYYVWQPNNGSLDNPNIMNPTASPLDSVTYTVIAMSNEGCQDSSHVHIDINGAMQEQMANAFTPNNDGKNDVFRIGNIQYQKLVDFRVFNRWGQVIFQTADPTKGWDGTFNGVLQNMDTYNYMVTLIMPDGTQKVVRGAVTLIR